MDHLDEFLLYCISEKGLSLKTIASYKSDLLAFFKTCLSISSVEKSDVLDYLASLHRDGYAPPSISRKLVSLKVFFRFLKREKYIEIDPTLHLDGGKKAFILPSVLSPGEVKNLLEVLEGEDEISLRDRAILECLYASGLRVSELCSLNLYDLGHSEFRVIGKGGKERIVPVAERTTGIITEYLTFREVNKKDNPPLFATKKGRRLDRQMVWKLVKKAQKLAGIKKPISPHTLRHSYATHLLEGGADIRVIQELLGHAHISTTDIYTHISKGYLQTAFESCHPRANDDSH